MPECYLCKKIFPTASKLERHNNRKIPCNAIKEPIECKICNSNFPCIAKLERHNN